MPVENLVLLTHSISFKQKSSKGDFKDKKKS